MYKRIQTRRAFKFSAFSAEYPHVFVGVRARVLVHENTCVPVSACMYAYNFHMHVYIYKHAFICSHSIYIYNFTMHFHTAGRLVVCECVKIYVYMYTS